MTSEAARLSDLERLYQSMRGELRGFIQRRIRDSAAVDDLLHDIFLKIHAGRDRVKDPARLEAWIYRISRNAIHDWYRHRRPDEPMSPGLEARLAAPDAEAEMTRRLAPTIRACVGRLREPYRRALIESDLNGVPQKALAAELGVSYSGLKSRVQRARRMIHEMLLACCHFELDARGGILHYAPRTACSCAGSERSAEPGDCGGRRARRAGGGGR